MSCRLAESAKDHYQLLFREIRADRAFLDAPAKEGSDRIIQSSPGGRPVRPVHHLSEQTLTSHNLAHMPQFPGAWTCLRYKRSRPSPASSDAAEATRRVESTDSKSAFSQGLIERVAMENPNRFEAKGSA